jgi:hypothetical protein
MITGSRDGRNNRKRPEVKHLTMEKNGIHVNGSIPSAASETADIPKELAQLRVRLSEIASIMRRVHGRESGEARLTEDVSAAVQRLEAQLLGCASAKFE